MAFTLEMARSALKKFDALIDEKKDYLTDLDSAIGDADHGINMSRGMKRVMEKTGAKEYSDFGGLYKDVAMTIMSAVGGSAGPLYGTFFMKMGQKLAGRSEAVPEEIADAMQEGLNSIMTLGKSQMGDKTMVDAMQPAVDALRNEDQPEKNEIDLWEAAVEAAEKGMKDTIPMLAKRGRSSYLGERSIGHQDPGATSVLYLFVSFRDACRES
jgi:dihydroxyacetone kinase-like protein